jgi:hypothetical protein
MVSAILTCVAAVIAIANKSGIQSEPSPSYQSHHPWYVTISIRLINVLHQTAMTFLTDSSVARMARGQYTILTFEEKTYKTSVRLINILAEVHTPHLLNISWKLYCLCHVALKKVIPVTGRGGL